VAVGGVAEVVKGGRQGDPEKMDPDSQNESFTNSVNGQIYEFLNARDRNLQLVPSLATEWKQESPTRWIFKLRQGVKFHDGRPFTADDVVVSFARAGQKT